MTIPPKGRKAGPTLGQSQVIADLQRAVEAGDTGAVAQLWQRVERQGAPLIEAVPVSDLIAPTVLPESAGVLGSPGARGPAYVGDDATRDRELQVTFVAREADPAVEVVLLANRVTDPEAYASSVLRPVPGTDVRYLTIRMRSDWRGSYAIGRVPATGPAELPERAQRMIENSLRVGMPAARLDLEKWHGASANGGADPFHKRVDWPAQVADGSWVSLPDAPVAGVAFRPEGPAGELVEHRFGSAALGNERRVWTYETPGTGIVSDHGTVGSNSTSNTPISLALSPANDCAAPAGGDSEIDADQRWLLVLTDGETWARNGVIAAVLDQACQAGELPPMTVVMIDSIDVPTRTRELACSPDFVDAVVHELLPQLQLDSWTVPERTIIAGSSLGGLTALYAAMRASRTFGNAYSMSGSFWWPSVKNPNEEPAWLTRCYAAAPKLPTRFRLEVGLLEHGLLGYTRHMRDVLVAKGYDVSYSEFNGGHDKLCWVAGFAAGLKQLIADG